MNYWIITDGASRLIIQARDELEAWKQIKARWQQWGQSLKHCAAEPYVGAWR